MPPTIYLSTFGSFGDIYPFVAICRALQKRGADPIPFVNPAFVEAFTEHGIETQPVGERIDVDQLLRDNPQYFHPQKGTQLVMEDLFAPFSAHTLAAGLALAEMRPPALCVAHHMAIGPAWVARQLGVPQVMTHLSPVSLLSRTDPPVIGPGNQPAWFRKLLLKLAMPMFRKMMAKIYGRAAEKAGVQPVEPDIMKLIMQPDLLLGMWSPTFRGLAKDDPPNTQLAGFPLSAPGEGGASVELERFLSGGSPPIAFGLGSSAVYLPGDFFEHAVEACGELGQRGLLFGKEAAPENLPDNVMAVGFEPFDEVLPRCAAFVHHGSIGSTAAGLRAGVPTVVMPHAHDQFDHAATVKRLGVSQTIQRKRLSKQAMVEALRTVLTDEHRMRAQKLSATIRTEGEGAEKAADILLELADQHR